MAKSIKKEKGKIDIGVAICFWLIVIIIFSLIWEGQQTAYEAGWNHEEMPSVDYRQDYGW